MESYEQFKQQVTTTEPAFTLNQENSIAFNTMLDEITVNFGSFILILAVILYLHKKKRAAFFTIFVSIAYCLSVMCRNW